MSKHLLFVALDTMAIFGSALLAARLLASLPRNPNARLIALLLISGVCHVLLTRHEYGFWIPPVVQVDVGAWAPLLNIGRNMAPGVYMLICYCLFQEPRSFPGWLLALFGVQLFLEGPVNLVLPADIDVAWFMTVTAPSLLQALFVCFALYWTVADWRADLVETRRRLRALFLLIIGVQMLASSLLLRVIIPWELILSYYVHMSLVGVNAMIITLVLFTLMGDDLRRYLEVDRAAAGAGPAEPEPVPDQADGDALARLQRLLEQERIHREAGLSLRRLADRMQMPEYRLRSLIHGRLGYRNFNALVHEYRIREACEMLRDPDMVRTPILTIALSVGYQSVNTFNRGFRTSMGMTPSDYRKLRVSGAAPVGTVPGANDGSVAG